MYPEEGPWREFKEEITSELIKLNIRIEPIRAPEGKGDFTCVCYQVASQMKKDPKQIAADIAASINSSDHEWIASCEAAGPYVNFTVCSEKLAAATISAVRDSQTPYGSSPPKGKKVIIEHTSANPTDALHVGRTRNPIIGDTLARIMRAAGYEVQTQYYVDDLGRQAVTLALGKYGLDEIPEGDNAAFEKLKSESPGPYQLANAAAEKLQWAADLRADWLSRLEHGDPDVTDKVNKATDEVMASKIKPTLDRINVHIGEYVHESRFLADTMNLVPQLTESPLHDKSEDGAHFLAFPGIDKEFFFLRADGTTVYATRDIAYHIWKSERAGILINILGEDHRLESKFVELAIKEVLQKPLNLNVVFYSFVSLPEGRMSTRKGNVVLIDDLLDEAVERAGDEVKKRRPEIPEQQAESIARSVGIGAVRYNIIKVQPEKKIIFKWEDALNFEGESAPFIQYSHARACGILAKCNKAEGFDASLLNHPSEIALVKKMADLPRLVDACAEKRRCHTMASYAHELAQLFNQFYRDCPVAAAPTPELQAARAALTDAFRTCMRNTLDMLGIDALEEM